MKLKEVLKKKQNLLFMTAESLFSAAQDNAGVMKYVFCRAEQQGINAMNFEALEYGD